MSTPPSPVVVTTGPLQRMRELVRVLEAAALEAGIVGSPGGSSA